MHSVFAVEVKEQSTNPVLQEKLIFIQLLLPLGYVCNAPLFEVWSQGVKNFQYPVPIWKENTELYKKWEYFPFHQTLTVKLWLQQYFPVKELQLNASF